MKKAFSLTLFVFGMIALSIIFVLNSPSKREGGSVLPDQTLKAPAVQNKASEATHLKSLKKTDPSHKISLSKRFLDSQLSMGERLGAWVELNQNQRPSPEVLTDIATSENPYNNQERSPHSVAEMDFRREEGLRIMALQGLEKAAIENPGLIKFIESVAQNASSPSVRTIASKMIPFVQKGKSYSDLSSQAIMNLEIPQ